MQKYKIALSAASGIEGAVKIELKRLKIEPKPFINGIMSIEGDSQMVARLNMFLRTADRVYIEVASFRAESFDELFENTKNIEWESYVERQGKILINGKSHKSKLYAVSASQSIIQKAISVRLCEKYRLNRLSETGAEYKIEFSIYEDEVKIYLNTSGVGLHKRGYRNLVGVAPLRETLASAMLIYSNFRYEAPLIDPFCGSGTIPIEAGLMALNIASGKFREFDYQKWQTFDNSAYRLAYEEAIDGEVSRNIDILGSDIDSKAIALSKKHLKNAGLGERIKFKTCAVKDLKITTANGAIVTNAPYGERVLDKESVKEVYKDLRKIYSGLNNFSLHLLTSHPSFERTFGKSADKNRKLYNANKECKMYSYYNKRIKNL